MFLAGFLVMIGWALAALGGVILAAWAVAQARSIADGHRRLVGLRESARALEASVDRMLGGAR